MSTCLKKNKFETDKQIIWTKTVCFGKIAYLGDRKINAVEVKIQLTYNKDDKKYRFSVCGDIWNSRHTDIVCGGQCHEEIWAYFNDEPFKTIRDWWLKYHLNDMHAGTPEQEEYLKMFSRLNYTEQCDILRQAGLYEVEYEGKPYKYGTDWLYRAIPEADLNAIIKFLEE